MSERWPVGARVYKVRGSNWRGRVCGYYETSLTHEGYCVESEREPGSVQIYPRAALAMVAAESRGEERSDRHKVGTIPTFRRSVELEGFSPPSQGAEK